MNKDIKQLIAIAEALETFKHKVYTLMNKEDWLDDFLLNNAPCNYNLRELIKRIRKEEESKEVKKK